MSDNREELKVHACGDPGSWVRNVQINPHIALTALSLLEQYFHHGHSLQWWNEVRTYLIEQKRIDPADAPTLAINPSARSMIDCEACGRTHPGDFLYCPD